MSLAGGLSWITRGGKCWCMGGFGNPWWHHWLYCKNLFHVCAFKLSERMVTCAFYLEDTVFIASKDGSLQSSKWFFSSIYLIPSQELFKAHFVLNHHALKRFSMWFLSRCFHMLFFSSSSSFCFFLCSTHSLFSGLGCPLFPIAWYIVRSEISITILGYVSILFWSTLVREYADVLHPHTKLKNLFYLHFMFVAADFLIKYAAITSHK